MRLARPKAAVGIGPNRGIPLAIVIVCRSPRPKMAQPTAHLQALPLIGFHNLRIAAGLKFPIRALMVAVLNKNMQLGCHRRGHSGT